MEFESQSGEPGRIGAFTCSLHVARLCQAKRHQRSIVMQSGSSYYKQKSKFILSISTMHHQRRLHEFFGGVQSVSRHWHLIYTWNVPHGRNRVDSTA